MGLIDVCQHVNKGSEFEQSRLSRCPSTHLVPRGLVVNATLRCRAYAWEQPCNRSNSTRVEALFGQPLD
jgi:hypothetical protein